MNTIQRVKELAASHGMTLFQLAKLCDLNYNTLKSAEERHYQLSVDTIEIICQFHLRRTLSLEDGDHVDVRITL